MDGEIGFPLGGAVSGLISAGTSLLTAASDGLATLALGAGGLGAGLSAGSSMGLGAAGAAVAGMAIAFSRALETVPLWAQLLDFLDGRGGSAAAVPISWAEAETPGEWPKPKAGQVLIYWFEVYQVAGILHSGQGTEAETMRGLWRQIRYATTSEEGLPEILGPDATMPSNVENYLRSYTPYFKSGGLTVNYRWRLNSRSEIEGNGSFDWLYGAGALNTLTKPFVLKDVYVVSGPSDINPATREAPPSVPSVPADPAWLDSLLGRQFQGLAPVPAGLSSQSVASPWDWGAAPSDIPGSVLPVPETDAAPLPLPEAVPLPSGLADASGVAAASPFAEAAAASVPVASPLKDAVPWPFVGPVPGSRPAAPPVVQTPPGAVIEAGLLVDGRRKAPPPTMVGIASELGNQERKLEAILDMLRGLGSAGGGGSGGNGIDDVLGLLSELREGVTYKIRPPCGRKPDGSPLDPIEFDVPSLRGVVEPVIARIDALAEMIDIQKTLRGLVGKSDNVGAPVTITFREVAEDG